MFQYISGGLEIDKMDVGSRVTWHGENLGQKNTLKR